ncbi:MAG: hypothetical protein Ct9H300mP27_05630 [Chloroflexota bacterium]|nr:MAG: hypothetical protein Ct9H300mP27_05630 [Chloroflexota bacterium]
MSSSWRYISVDDNDMDIYSGMPDSNTYGDGPFPAVVVAQAAGGGENLSKNRRPSSESGYYALAPDLYHRTTPEIEKSTGKTRRQLLVDNEIIRDIDATVQHFQQDILATTAKLA